MADLDSFDPPRADPGDMLGRIRDLPQQVRDAWQAAGALTLPDSYRAARAVLVLGMGGSAMGGDLLRVYAAGECHVPIMVSRDYDLPSWVDGNTLVIAISFSGGTEETLSAFEQAAGCGARLLAIATGGRLAEMAQAFGTPLLKIQHQSQPRAAIGYLFTPLIRIASALGFLPNKSGDHDEAVRMLERLRDECAPERPAPDNGAKRLALALCGKIPIIYGAGPLAAVARRWKTQLNENAKILAGYEVYPELTHNAVVGYAHPEATRRDVAVVELDSPLVHPRVRVRMDVTERIMRQSGVAYHRVLAQGQSALAQVYSTITFGDYVSYYLAILNDADPTPVETITYLKSELAKYQHVHE